MSAATNARAERAPRYQAKPDLIVRTAAVTFDGMGVGGATLADVASAGELNLTGIRHYFTRKDELVAAAYHRSLDFHEALIEEARAGRTARDRVEHCRANSAADGKVLWDYDTSMAHTLVLDKQVFGGVMDGAGPTVAGGMVYGHSGYAGRQTGNRQDLSGREGNVPMAFSVDGK